MFIYVYRRDDPVWSSEKTTRRVGLRPTVTNEIFSGSLKDCFNGMIFWWVEDPPYNKDKRTKPF
ncbi:MAG: hypothetical protein IKI11_04860 [Neisseriaceae bacterium]|nr:hypothetical protein [Neisseriaceae bacterium]